MFDFDNEMPEVPAGQENVEQPAENNGWEDVESFISAEEGFELPDPDSVVTIRTTTGGDKYVPVSEPTPVSEIIARSGLFFGGAVEYYLNGSTIRPDELVPPGSTLTVIGSVKGG